MKLPINQRLLACCGFVRPGDRVADVGCDHGYLGIHLLQNGLSPFVIESDINPQPLSAAKRNAEKFGVAGKMAFYLSDGVKDIPRDFDCLVCAGMGADTMISILRAAPWLKSEAYRLILQCQSRLPQLRKYLSQEGYAIRRETLVEDGKFIYPIMEVVFAPGSPLTESQCYLSPALARSGSPLLEAYRQRLLSGLSQTIQGLERSGGARYAYYQKIWEELTHDQGL